MNLEAVAADLSGPARAAPCRSSTQPATGAAVETLVGRCTACGTSGETASFRHELSERDVEAADVLDLVRLALVWAGSPPRHSRPRRGPGGDALEVGALLAPQLENGLVRRALAGRSWSRSRWSTPSDERTGLFL